MNPTDLFFYLFAAMAVLSGILVVANPITRSPVTSAMFLVLTIMWLAALYILLNAFFLAAVQILVYAGAVMVLFLFVIMLLDLKAEEQRQIRVFGMVTGVVSVGVFGLLLTRTLWTATAGNEAQPALRGEVRELGTALFTTQYLLPFEILSFLLLVAMVGAILLSKKELK